VIYYYEENQETAKANKAVLYHNRGMAHQSLRNYLQSAKDYKYASELNPMNPEHLKKYIEVKNLIDRVNE